MRLELRAQPADPGFELDLREAPIPEPRRGHVLVRVRAASVNPIDVKRAQGYGRRLLSLKGATRYPVVLGNDFAGEVQATGEGVTNWRAGQRVFGVLDTGRQGGTHATHICVPEQRLLMAPPGKTFDELAVLPYSYATMRLALRGAGLTPELASGRRILVNGASGALGQLALGLLSRWNGIVTAVCGAGREATCLSNGAAEAFARGPGVFAALSPFDATLNFGSWEDERALIGRLAPKAIGHATTVHPLIAHFDQLGWFKGALANRRSWTECRNEARATNARTRYSWTLFRPDMQALMQLEEEVSAGRIKLPVAMTQTLADAAVAFTHAKQGRPGRAVLVAQ